jgi:polysaccharide export outer membrane protein
LLIWAILLGCAGVSGCVHGHHRPDPESPREFAKITHPPYTIEAPDVLLIDAVRLVPKPPYRVEPLDSLVIQVTQAGGKPPAPDRPIAGIYTVNPEGYVDLGYDYGSVPLSGRTLAEARDIIKASLKPRIKPELDVVVEVAQTRALQQVRGEHMVRADGTIGLGTYGSVFVDGMTLAQAKEAVELHLSQFLVNPQVSLDVGGYNSKVYYIIFDGGGNGQQMYRLPITGKETVLDAISLVNGLPAVASKSHMWVARPMPAEADGECKLAVNWHAITQRGSTLTNYQLLPGDRLFVKAAPLVTADTYLGRIIQPIERVLGLGLLYTTTQNAFQTTAGGGTTGIR